jgi:hypothetical protein
MMSEFRFQQTSCSECGREFGPGNHGYSHCSSHTKEKPMSPEVMLVPRREGENHHVIAARLRLMREALRSSGIEAANRLMDRAEAYAIDLLADPDDEANYEKAEGLLDRIEMLFQVPARELTTCVNGHRSTVPTNAIRSLSAATYSCPVCGKGVPSKKSADLTPSLAPQERPTEGSGR